jgi:very-short-patch-repair endonuclease
MARRTDMRGGQPIKARARRLRGNMTDAEQLLWRELRRNQPGWRFRRQFPIPPYVVDFVCIEARLIVEADGGQHAFRGEDDRRDAYLQRQGWRVLRLWNNDILSNRAGVLQTIAGSLKSPREQSPHPSPPPLAGEGARGAPPRAPSSALVAEAALRDGFPDARSSGPRSSAALSVAAREGKSPPPQAGEG